jgi:hypothetical protein
MGKMTVCCVLAFGLLGAGTSHADTDQPVGCKDATITGASQADATGAFLGTGKLGLDGNVVPITWVSVIKTFLQNSDGTLTLTSSHHITSSTNSSIDFTTTDAVAAQPTDTPGVYTFLSHLTVESGKGPVKTGFLDVNGHVDLVHGTVRIDSSSGNVCASAP